VSAVAHANSRTNHKLQFLCGQRWNGSYWVAALRVQELTTALATFNGADQQAVRVPVTCAAHGTISLSLGCSAALAAPTTLAHVTAQTLRSRCHFRELPGRKSSLRYGPHLDSF
jgi:hypothetical protein